MLKAIATVSSKVDNTLKVDKSLKNLGNMDAYIGIPEGPDHQDSNVTDAQLLYALSHGVRASEMIKDMQPSLDAGTPYSKAHQMYIHEHGSPLWRIPPRPVLEPAISNSKEAIANQLKKAAIAALDGKDATPELQKAGIMGMNAAKDWFTNPSNSWPPNAPSTIKAKGSENPNIDTGELRKSITYVVRQND